MGSSLNYGPCFGEQKKDPNFKNYSTHTILYFHPDCASEDS